MISPRFRIISLILCIFFMCGSPAVSAQSNKKGKTTAKTTNTTKKSNAAPAKKQNAAKGKTAAKNSGKKSTAVKKQETSEDVKRRQEATRKEIEQTKAQIARTDKEISKNLGTLNKLRGEIDNSKKAVADASAQVKTLAERIGILEKDIETNELQISKLRDEYLKAIKKMRARKGSKSDLAFIFSSKNFNQAMRRMRYLSQFSAWRSAQSSVLNGKIESLREDQKQLALDKVKKDEALVKESEAQKKLQQQYSAQDAIVVKLRANSAALKNHLAAKQAEANTLRNRISALIAQEQARAEEKRRQEKLEAERKEKQRKEAKEAARKAEQDKLLAQAEKDKKAGSKNDQKGKQQKENPKKEDTGQKNKKNDASKKSDGKNYAEARNRTPRGDNAVKSERTEVSVGNNFERLKGSLPHPVAGSFRITSKFGRHPLPELPEVVYDNPGIDAEVAKGASAQAVASGKVTGIYVIPGFNTVVIVSHGNYYSVYGNLASPSVSVGQSLTQGQVVGTVAAMEDNPSKGSIHFEIWKNRDKLNPESWIKL